MLIFTEGTVLKPANEDKTHDYVNYQPAGQAAAKVTAWSEQGAEISYLTSRIKFLEIKQIKDVLAKFNFPAADKVHARAGTESYLDIVARSRPDVLVEDDCQSIGEQDVVTPKLNPEWGIHGIVVPEFGGIDHLPDNLEELKEYGKTEKTDEAKEDEV